MPWLKVSTPPAQDIQVGSLQDRLFPPLQNDRRVGPLVVEAIAWAVSALNFVSLVPGFESHWSQNFNC